MLEATKVNTVKQKNIVNDLLGNIKTEFENLIVLTRKLGAEEMQEAFESDKIHYALEVLTDMVDRCEKPSVIIKELKQKLSELDESPF